MREELIKLKDVSIVGVLTHRQVELLESNYCVIFLNTGLAHMVGPNRIYVKAARYLAGKGVTCFRFDFSEQGDSNRSNKDMEQSECRISEIKLAMDAVEKCTGINQFFLIGTCLGAETAFKASLTDDRVVGVSLINGVYKREQILSIVYEIAARNYNYRYYKKHFFKLTRWKKILTDKSSAFRIKDVIGLQFLVKLIKRILSLYVQRNINSMTSHGQPNTLSYNMEEWESLFKRNVRIHVLFCEGGMAVDIFDLTIGKLLRKYMNNNLFKLEFVKDADHMFTPIWSQDLFVNLLTERVLK